MPCKNEAINSIIEQCRRESNETTWIEFKENNCNPQQIGEYISALSNSAALHSRSTAYMIWGIQDGTHNIVGTKFDPAKTKKGNQSLDNWLATQLDPSVQFYFHKTQIESKELVLLEINRASSSPVKFCSIDYIRLGSNKKKLKDFPDTQRALWAIFAKTRYETLTALEDVSADTALKLFDYSSYFAMLSLDLPTDKSSILEILLADRMIVKAETGNYDITNLGALLFAKQISEFPSLERKAVRVIRYDGNDRVTSTSKEQVGRKGYANGFEGLIDFIHGLLPLNEVMGQALRKEVPMYPKLAVRELVANALIHQDLHLTGSSPLIEIFNDRMEITNPGTPLINKERFIDYPPVSRNEKLASFMRRIGICEERGSGFDKVVSQTEYYQLPAPEIDVYENNTKISLFAHKTFAQMSKADRQRACYLHACLKKVNRDYMTNATLRERFNIEAKNTSMISRLLNETCKSKMIKITEDSTGDSNRKYIPYWG